MSNLHKLSRVVYLPFTIRLTGSQVAMLETMLDLFTESQVSKKHKGEFSDTS